MMAMEEIVSKFSGKIAIIEDEQQVIVVNKHEDEPLKSSKVFLVGKVLSYKPVNKEIFERQMRNLWRPKANVLIFDLEDDLFVFGFNNLYERTSILRGGPWLFNKQYLLILVEADSMA